MCGTNQVLIVTPFYKPNIGGAETFAEDLAKALSGKHIVHICTIKWEKPVLWQGINLWNGIKMSFKLLPSLWRMTRKYKYEKIYALGLIPSFLCMLLDIKYYSVMLALYDFKKVNFFTGILNYAQKVFVEGDKGKQDMLKCGVKEDKIVKFQHWCDQTKFSYIPKNNENLKVLFVGRPIKIKGKQVIEDCEKLTKGIEYEYIENIPYEDLPKHYQMADVVVVPSLYSEGFSRVVIEAASCGCALVTSNRGALPELVKDFGNYIEPTPEKFAEVLFKLKHNKIGLEQIQTNTAIYASKNFSHKNIEVFF